MRTRWDPRTRLRKIAITLFAALAGFLALAPVTATAQGGIQWTSRTSAADNSWYSVTFGGGQFVAVSNQGNGNRVMTSPDGATWTSRASPVDNSWLSVAYGNGMYVATAWSGSADRVMTSPDGFTWTTRNAGSDRRWRSITYAEGLFVAVAESGSGALAGKRVMTSTDGLNWTDRDAGAGHAWYSVTHGQGRFVAVALTGRVMTSPDGVVWQDTSEPGSWTSVTYGGGQFVAVSNAGSSPSVMTSPDGTNWTPRTALAGTWHGVAYGDGRFVAVGSTAPRAMTSSDGVAWTATTPAASNEWFSVTFGNGAFVAVSLTGSGNRVMTGVPLPAVPDSPAKPTAIAGDAQATVSVAQGSGAGAAPLSYTVTSSPDGRTCTVTVPGTSCTVTGLTNGTAYTFTATGTNAGGTSGPSVPSDPVTPTAPQVPSPAPPAPPLSSPVGSPTGTSVTPGDRQARVTFTAPSAGQGEVRYVVTLRPVAYASVVAVGPARSFPIDLAVDADGTAYSLASYLNNGLAVRVTNPDGRVGSVVARWGEPLGVVTDPRGVVYWTNYYKRSITKYTPGGGQGILARVGRNPRPIALDRAGNVYTGDAYDGAITRTSPEGLSETIGRTADEPYAIGIDAAGRVNVLTRGRGERFLTRRLERFDPMGPPRSHALAGVPEALAVDAEGNAYLANREGHPVTRVTPDGAVAPYGPTGFARQYEQANGVAVADDGTVYYSSLQVRTGLRAESGGQVTGIGRDGRLHRVHSGDRDVPLQLVVNAAGGIYWIDGAQAWLMRATPLTTRTCTVVSSPLSPVRMGCTVTDLVNGATYEAIVQGANEIGEGPASDPVRATPRATLQAVVADPPPASRGATTSLSAQMGFAGSTMSASATPAGAAASSASHHALLRAAHAKTPKRVSGQCATRGLTATCRLRLAKGRWRITLTERNNGAVVGQAATVLRATGARKVAVTG